MHEHHPEILVLSNIIRDGRPVGVAQGGQFWHSDLYFNRIPAAASLLLARVAPATAGPDVGDTVFADMAAAYEALPATLRQRTDGLKKQG